MRKISPIIGVIIIFALIWATFSVLGDRSSDNNYCGANGKITSTKLIQSHRSYCVSSTHPETMQVGAPNNYVFSIIDDQGEKLKDFEIVHEKIMHVIIIRKDLAEFQHIHPVFDSTTGSFTLAKLTFPSNGEYRIFTDFTPKNTQMGQDGKPLGVTIYEDIAVGEVNKYTAQALGPETREDIVGKYTITLKIPTLIQNDIEQHLTFTIKKDSKQLADIKPYLGAYGHVIVLREGTLDFLHAHPIDETAPKNSEVNFMTKFTQPGKYKVFGQFQTSDELLTSEFVVDVKERSTNEPMIDHGSMNH